MNMFDIVVPTFNRYAELPLFFEKNAALANNDRVILWIIDDCSTKYDATVIPSWTNLRFIRLDKNRGQAFARNIAIENSIAPYVISLDDDAWFEDGGAYLHLVHEQFEKAPDTGCVMFNVATPGSSYSSMASGTVLPLHVTCGCAYRREVLKVTGGFTGFLHSQSEETDISLRIYRDGWAIRFLNEVKVFHNFDFTGRPLSWLYYVRYNTTRNDLLVVLMYYPWFCVLPFIFGKFFSHLRYAVYQGQSVVRTFFVTFSAFFGFLGMSVRALRRRKPLSWKQFSKWRNLFNTNAN